MNKVLALMTINDSMAGQAFAIFIQHFLCPQLWEGAVVVMDNSGGDNPVLTLS
jgi:hypothetical protein